MRLWGQDRTLSGPGLDSWLFDTAWHRRPPPPSRAASASSPPPPTTVTILRSHSGSSRLLVPELCRYTNRSVARTSPYSERMAETLEHVWTSGPQGHLSPLETLKAWALGKVYLEEGYSEKGLYVKIASKVSKVGGGQPGPDAVRKLLLRIEEDPSWYPGKKQGDTPGRKRALSEQARQSIKRSAEAIKESGLEPTYPLILARCPNATRTPDTGEPVDKRAVYDVFRTLCYDEGAEVPWDHVARLQKTALSAPVRERRAAWAAFMVQEVGHTAGWYYRHRHCRWSCRGRRPRLKSRRSPGRARRGGAARTARSTLGSSRGSAKP